MKWTEDKACMGLMINGTKFQLETLRRRNHMGDFGAYLKIIPRLILKKWGFRYIDCIRLAQDRIK
jgi:hypothetical protein